MERKKAIEKQVLHYRVIIEPEKYKNGSTVYAAYCPTLGVSDYGDTVDDVLLSIKEGIDLAIEHLDKENKEIPIDKIDEQIITSTKINLPTRSRQIFAS